MAAGDPLDLREETGDKGLFARMAREVGGEVGGEVGDLAEKIDPACAGAEHESRDIGGGDPEREPGLLAGSRVLDICLLPW